MSRRIPWWEPQVGPEEYSALKSVLDSNYLNDGDVTERFEQLLAARTGVRFAVAVTSGTTAIHLALVAAGVGPGDEVIVPDLTFIATANAVTLAGASVVLADIDESLTLAPAAFEKVITPRTKAVVPVHVSGRGAAVESISQIAARHGIAVIEDAAEAFVSCRGGKALGTFGLAGCFSFSPNKSITTGQGGAILTGDERMHTRLRELKDQGRPVRGTGGDDLHLSVGFNAKLTNLQAAIGIAQMARLDARLGRQRSIYRRYEEGLRDVPQIRLLGFDLDHGECPLWTDALAERRDDLDRHLADRGMGCRRFWHPIHTQPPYRGSDDAFPQASRLAPRAIWLPSAFTLTDDDIRSVCAEIRAFYRT